ncbi:MAG: SDR family NAD(P)-dependent oxidoreductase [Verrucomicrobia bacterium]|nr:SDR family NAD(P)-dependent oxidoreductase [Verrucomicrobiota bacterium]
MPSRLTDSWVLITGASSGIGAAAARAFAAEGANVLLGARRLDRLQAVAASARHAGAPNAMFHELDVSRTSSVDAFVEWAKDQIERCGPHGRSPAALDVLINNAGGAKGLDPVADGKDDDWEFMMQTNVLGLLRVTRACLPLLVDQPGSCLLNIGSIAGRQGYQNGAAYCAAKHGERAITQALRLELCGKPVRVCTVDPGFVETEFSLVRFHGDAGRARKVYEGMVPLRAEDIAEALVWVAARPPHVCIDELVIKPTDQAAIDKVHRRTASA